MTTTDALIADLNQPQREAVTYGEGPLLVVAGAGSGKTRVITRRVAWLIEQGVSPSDILAITFTNKAAGEMRGRVEALMGEGKVWMSTFHSFCARVLRRDGSAVGLQPGFSIYDRDDQLSVVKEICGDLSIDTQHVRPAALLGGLSRYKNEGIGPEEAAAVAGDFFERNVAQVYERYQDSLEVANAADFDDLLLKVRQLFAEHTPILAKYQQQFRYVMVDEYQDTNHIQYCIARDVAAGHGNLCATGDPDQAIYAWRGACIRNILEFEKDFPGAHLVRLEQNYRSTGQILAAASALISNNPARLMGPLWSELGEGDKVSVTALDDEEVEADHVIRQVVKKQQSGIALSDMAVFYRTNALSRRLERALRLHNVPYEIVGAVEFYKRKEVKDVLAYLRVLANPNDAVAFLRIVNTPTRGIGKTSLQRLRKWAVPLGLSPRAAARRAEEAPELTPRAKKSLAALTALLDDLEKTLEGAPEETLSAVLDRTDYLTYLRDYGGQDGLDRVDNVRELETALAAYTINAIEPTIGGFLEETALVSEIDQLDLDGDRLPLMTLHAAKGLEFPVVFIIGLEEGLLPHQRSFDEPESIQEERRLFYVGMTRAQRHLHLSFSDRRPIMGAWMPTTPSRFLDEIPEDCLVQEDQRARHETKGRGRKGADQTSRGGEIYLPDPDDYVDVPGKTAVPRPNDSVRHPHFGQGVVLEVRGTGVKARITVNFEHFGEKLLIAEYSRLEKVE